MKNKKSLLQKYLITISILLLSSIIFQLIIYRFNFRLDNISNSIFFVNIIVFSISLILQTGASRTFISMSYTFKTWFKYKDTKEKYDNFKEYYDDNEQKHKKEVMHVIYATLTLIVISIILGIIYVSI